MSRNVPEFLAERNTLGEDGMKVDFTLTEYVQQARAVTEAAREAFGPEISKFLLGTRPIRIRCRPDQMMRFLVTRNDLGGTNGWKDLNVKLVDARPTTFVDVSNYR